MKKRFISTTPGTHGKRVSILPCIVVLLFIVGIVQQGWTEANIHPVNNVGSQPVKDVKKITGKRMVIPGFGNIPLYFIPNKGQMHEKALFCAKTPRYNLWLTKEGLVFDSIKQVKVKAEVKEEAAPFGRIINAFGKDTKKVKEVPGKVLSPGIHASMQSCNHAPRQYHSHSPHSPYLTHSPKLEREVSRLIFLKANKNPLVVPGEKTGYRVNYLKGSDKSQWHTDIPTSRAVCYKNLYKNIDLKVYGVEKQIEYDWVVKPGSNPADIRFQYLGVKETSRDEAGNLVVQTPSGQWTHKKPLAYQEINGKKVFVEAAFKRLNGKNTYGFRVAPYNKNYELIIDPMVIVFSTYLGGSETDEFYSLYVTGSGAVYAAGISDSSDFPVENAYQSSCGGGLDAVVTKFSADGTSLVFSTYIGGSEFDCANAVWVDSSGIVYLGGPTGSSDFPTVNAYQSYKGGGEYSVDGFIAKLSADGSSLLYSTYLGGNVDDEIGDIAVNSSGDIYAAGWTSSSDFPLENALQANNNGSADNFVLKLSSSGSSLVFSTYLGGSRWDEAHALTLDNSGAVYVAGGTLSSDFPVVNAFQSSDGNGGCTSCNDAFLSKISPDGQTLVYSTYLGGDSSDEIRDIKVDGSGAVYLVGSTDSSNFPTTPGAFLETEPSLYGWNVFISKFNSSMSAFLYSTYLGGTDDTNSIGWGMDIAADGTAYVTGYTESSDFPVRDPIQDSLQYNYSSAFVTALAPDGSDITFSTYLGGADEGSGNDIILDGSGNVYVVGWTEEGFLTHHGVQNSYGGGWHDGFVTKMMPGSLPDITVTAPNGGEEWYVYSTYDITWTADTSVEYVSIDFSPDNGVFWENITPSTPNTGSYSWTIPEFLSGNDCIVRVKDKFSSAADTSNEVFSVIRLPITVTSPNGGENWASYYSYDITWEADWSISDVSIDYSIDGGTSWIPIVCCIPSEGYYSWAIPDTLSDNCLVRVSDAFGTDLDVSDEVFSIVPAGYFIEVDSPNGGEDWAAGTNHDIFWSTGSSISSVSIDYSTDGGNTWTPIVLSTPDTGYFNWTVPNTPSGNCLVRVSDTGGMSSDVSDSAFTISAASSTFISVTSPNGGEEWYIGSSYDITWSYSGPIGYVSIDYSTDGGNSWIPYVDSVTNTGTYPWTIPDSPSTQCLVRVKDPSGAPADTSDGMFTITDPMIPLSERNALIELYNSTNGDYWWNKNNWRHPQDPTQFNDRGTEHTWFGITCNPEKTHVIEIVMYSNNLYGNLPDLSALTELRVLILEHGFLQGEIPATLNNLHNLEILNLYYNQLSGTIPDLSGLTNLETLHLHHNWLGGGIPPEIGNLSGLQFLLLNGNQLTGSIPSSLLNLTNLIDGGSDFRWNALYTDDISLRDFLNSKQTGGDWESTQTIAPTGLTVSEETYNSVKVSWIPILYQGGYGGGYRVYSSTTSGSNYTLAGTVFDKAADNYTVTKLDANTTYYFVVESFTDPHGSNPNTVTSEYSTEIPGTTLEGPTITVTAPNGGEEWEANTVRDITWTNDGFIEFVMIEYSLDNGNSWNVIEDSNLNDGSYPWMVPDTISSQCLVKVSHAEGGASDVSDAVFAITEPGTLNVTAPNGGENWEAATVQTITWTSTGSIANVMIEYSTDNGSSWNTITGSTANTGSYNWTIPNTPSSNCLVRISNTAGPASDVSDAVFNILEQRTITVTVPNGGENWEGVTVQTITWTSTGSIATVMIEYSTDNGSSWNTITSSTTNTGTYDWTIPNTPSSNCLVRISDTAGPASDVSDAVFNILEQRTITVTVPNGGEDWQVDSIHDITWTTTGAVANVDIEYSTNNGSSWNGIVFYTANTGTYSWTVPDTPSSDCLVRVSDNAGLAWDASDAVFTISTPTIPSTERDALIALYNSTNGDSWTNNTNWRKPGEPTQFNDPGTEPTWYGVTCNVDNTQVEKVQLSNNNLVGTIPAELDQLLYLNTLNLSENQLSGTIPTLSNLAQLENFILKNNALTGSVPTWLNNLSTLKDISLGHNQLSGTIPDLSSLSQLNTLSLSDNQLTGVIPTWLNNLTGLNALNLGSNQLTGAITDLSSLTNLSELFLHDNQLTGIIPAWLGNLTSLNTLNLALNQLTGNIPDLSSLTNLNDLKLHSNQLAGTIPSWISGLSNLRILELQSNQLSGSILAELGNLTALENLFLNSNQLIGDIPGTLSNLTNLYSTGLNISWNGLYTDDINLRDFLNSKSSDDWEATQTIAPEDISGSEESHNSVKVSWTPIQYQGDTGEYHVYYSTTSGSGYTLAGTTADKTAANYTVTSLDPSTTYYFVVETTTEPHSSNQNTVTSEYSTEISASTLQEPTLAVIAPNGGETWEATTVQTITWESTGNINNVKIEYTTDSGNTWNTVIASTANSGSYDWTIPNTPSANCLVKISDVGGLAQDQSDAVFTIAEQRTVTVTAPNGGENWEAVTVQTITWTSTGSIATVMIEYSTDNGSSWNTVTGSTTNTGSYDWTIPNTPSSNCLVKITDTAGPASDVSDAVFNILEQRTITVTVPNGGEDWQVDSIHDITWTSTGAVANVAIDYSSDSGSSWNTIVSSTANTGTYSWTVPDTPSSDCLVRISDTAGPASDASDAVFTISIPTIPSSERDALIALYNSTNGDSWTNNTNWRKPGEPSQFNDPGTEPTWYGVTCNVDNTQVEKVELSNNNLVGTIPAELDQLLYLNTLNLSENQLSGTIPDLNSLAQLNYLYLENNQLTGGIPTWLNNLTNLHSLDLEYNQLTGTIPDLSSLTNLNYLVMANNQLTGGIPPWLNNLTNLNTLDLRSNQLTGTIPDLSSLANLSYLALHSNQLTGNIPSWINNLTNLGNLGLSSNQLTGNIPDLSNLTKLSKLNLSYNRLTGSIPPELGSLNTLKYIYLNYNQLSGSIPVELGNLTALNMLYLNSNQLVGNIPGTLTNLTNLLSTGLNISWNGLYTDDVNLRDFLNSKSSDDWEATQTIAPVGLSSGEESHNSVKVSWTPIQYQEDSGEYRVYYSTTTGSGYTLAGSTADKTAANYTVTGLDPSTTYYFVVETVTEPHSSNQNTVTSEYSTEISAATLEEPTLTVTSPNGGESWEATTVQTITWASTGNINDVKIEYTTDSGNTWNTVIASTTNSESYDWTIPNTPSANCLVKISDVGGLAEDQSDAVFTIAEQRTLTVTSPNGGENWEGNTSQNITWNSTGSIVNVKIEYSTDNGSSWNTITGSTANDGSHNWTVPNTPSGNCLVKVSDTSGPASDVSNAVFTIAEQRTLTVTAPNGGENWDEGTTQVITWTYTGAIANVDIDYSTNGGTTWNSIVSSTPNTGSYNWVIPAEESGNCLVRVSDTVATASDTSDAVFTMWKQPSITVTTPNGGEVWKRFTTQTITWNSTGNIQDVKIQYSKNAGGNWGDIVSSTSNNGSYQWNIPNVNQDKTQCLVRVMTLDGTVVDTSDSYFTITKF